MKPILLGNHPSVKKINELIHIVGDTDLNVLILGETGTGKEVIARLLHSVSARRNKRFIKVNCAALPLTLLESELFGYEKGAFTGADRLKPGKFELASEGVILLDEIGDMPMPLQAKLLQVLQSGEFVRLGGTKDIKVHTWIISSTNHDLERDIQKGLFREDLYYRLNIIKIELPPLRERREDIPLLMDHFLEKYHQEFNLGNGINIASDIREMFQAYEWPGNVRELSNWVLRLLLDHDPEKVRSEMMDIMKADYPALPPGANQGGVSETDIQGGGGDALSNLRPLRSIQEEAKRYIERKAILHALTLTGWNKRKTSRLLKISNKALYNKMNDYGIIHNRKHSRKD